MYIKYWVPPYSVNHSYNILNDKRFSEKLKKVDAISLQFWTIKNNKLTVVEKYQNVDFYIEWYKQYCLENNIELHMCIYNGVDGWDWKIVDSILDNEKFINEIISESIKHNIKNVDIDFEGYDLNISKEKYISFIKQLSKLLHENNIRLSMCSFPLEWNFPNNTIWNEILPYVDNVISLCYEYIGSDNSSDSYMNQKQRLGDKLIVGVQTSMNKWKNRTEHEHIKYLTDNKYNIAMWDSLFLCKSWLSDKLWKRLRK